MKRDIDYENNNIGYDEQYPEGGIKCKNYEVCCEVLPKWWWDCKCRYLCTNCHMSFGTWDDKRILEFEKEEYLRKCSICRNKINFISRNSAELIH